MVYNMDGMNPGLATLLGTRSKIALSPGLTNRLWGGAVGGILGGLFGAHIHQAMGSPKKKFWKYTGIGAGIGGLGGAAVGMNLLGRGLEATYESRRQRDVWDAERAAAQEAERLGFRPSEAWEAGRAEDAARHKRYAEREDWFSRETARDAEQKRYETVRERQRQRDAVAQREADARHAEEAARVERERAQRQADADASAAERERFQEAWRREPGRPFEYYFRNGSANYESSPRSTFASSAGPWSNATTKAEAKKAFRDAARTAHPDMGGSKEKMQAVNAEWEAFKPHFEKLGFELAMAQLGLGS